MNFLDHAPIDWTRPEPRELRAILAQAFPELIYARQLAAQSGFDLADFPILTPTMQSTWHALMDKLAAQNKLRKLVEIAATEPMAAAWSPRLQQFLAADPPVEPPAPTQKHVAKVGLAATQDLVKITQQRLMLARPRYQPVATARRIGALARSVAYLELAFGAHRFHGTGFLIAPDRILTNHHNVVHPVHGALTSVTACFDEEEGHTGAALVRPGVPATIVAEPELDWAVITLDAPVDRDAITLGSPFDTVLDDDLIVIQHPLGGKKKFAIDFFSVRYLDASVVQYTADTQKGSSGSPVFNTRMHLVALHHAEVELIEVIAGKQVPVYRNEGMRIAPIIERLLAHAVPFTTTP